MIPENLSFHDAVIADIERDGDDYLLDIEDVAVDDGEDIVSGTLTLRGVRRIAADGAEAAEFEMEGDDGEIVELEEQPGPAIRLRVTWTRNDSPDETQTLYLIECKGLRWEAAE